MDPSLHRRTSVASSWALARIALLDSFERYEDSYAITQEFREWIICEGEDPRYLENAILKVPCLDKDSIKEETNDTDEVLEI